MASSRCCQACGYMWGYVTKKPRFGFERGFEQLPVRLCSRHRSRAVRAGRRRRRMVLTESHGGYMRAIVPIRQYPKDAKAASNVEKHRLADRPGCGNRCGRACWSASRLAISVSRRSAGTSFRIGSSRVRGLVGKIDPREQVRENAAHVDRDDQMCGACIAPFGPGTRPGLTVSNTKVPARSLSTRPKPLERGVGPARIARVRVAPLPVRLPDLEQDAVDRHSFAVEHPAFDADALADRVGGHEIAVDQLLTRDSSSCPFRSASGRAQRTARWSATA